MKSHVIVLCTTIFVFCFLMFGVRAGIVGPCCFFAGMTVKQKEEAVVQYIDRLQARILGWFKALNP